MYDATGHICLAVANPDRPAWTSPKSPTDAERSDGARAPHTCMKFIIVAARVFVVVADSAFHSATELPRPVIRVLDSARAPYVWNALTHSVTVYRIQVSVAGRTDTLLNVIDPDLMVVTGDTVAGLRVVPRAPRRGDRELFLLAPGARLRTWPIPSDIPFYYRAIAISPTAKYVAYVGSADEGDYPAIRELASGRFVVRGAGGGGCNCEVDMNHAWWITPDSAEIAVAYSSSHRGWLIFSARLSTKAVSTRWLPQEPHRPPAD